MVYSRNQKMNKWPMITRQLNKGKYKMGLCEHGQDVINVRKQSEIDSRK